MEVLRGWRVVPVPASGELLNVAALVLPAGMPVADDAEMRSRDELVNRLLDVLEMQARALSRGQQTLDGELLRQLQRDPVALRELYDQAIGTYQPPSPRRPGHRPNEKEMRDYARFRARFQKLERDIRRDLRLAPDDALTKETMAVNGGEHPKSMGDHMLWHGLTRDQWPPSTWPEEPPETPI